MWGNGGWRCTAHSSVEILDGHKLAEYGGEEIEEAVRQVQCGFWFHPPPVRPWKMLWSEGGREGGRDHAVHLTGLNGLYWLLPEQWLTYFVCSLKGTFKARGFITHLKNGGTQPALDATANAVSNGFIWCVYELLPSTQPHLKRAVVPGLLCLYVLL